MFQGVSKWFQKDPIRLQLTSTGFKRVFWGLGLHRLAGELQEELKVNIEIYQSVLRYFMAFALASEEFQRILGASQAFK